MNYFESGEFYIFGAGTTAKIFKKTLENNGKNVISFLVSRSQSSEIEGIPAVDISKKNEELNLSIPVIVAVFNREKNALPSFVYQYLKKYGFDKIIMLYDFFDHYSTHLDSMYWLTNRKFYSNNILKFQSAQSLFKDTSVH